MKNFSKLILISSLLAASNSFAGEMKIDLDGVFDFQAGYLKSNAPAGNNFVTSNQKNIGLYSTASLGLVAKNQLENGFVYGAKVGIETTTFSSRKNQSVIFTESDAGRLELGSDKTAMTKMRISHTSVSAATGGIWDTWVKADPLCTPTNAIPYATGFTNFLDTKMRLTGKVEYSRKITYYTPKWNGFQFGISYVPDSSNVGYSGLKDNVNHSPVFSQDFYYAVKNGFAGGITYDTKINDTKLSFAAVGETGLAKAKLKDQTSNIIVPKVKKLQNYTVGSMVEFEKLSFATSYGNYMKSFTSATDKNRNSHLYSFGVGYKPCEKIVTSITHFASNYRKNKLGATTIAVDYKLAPGFMPYAEATIFNAKGRHLENPEEKFSSHKGTLAIVGAKVTF